jgi:hypothetical protein
VRFASRRYRNWPTSPGDLNVPVREFRQTPSRATGAPGSGEARLGALPNQAALELGQRVEDVKKPDTPAQDTFSVGTLKGVGRVYQQTVIDTYAKLAFAKLYDRKTPITAAEILNHRVVPFFDEHGIRLSRMLTDRGTEFCGTQRHEYELYLAVEDIDHRRTKTNSPQTLMWSTRGIFCRPCRFSVWPARSRFSVL